LKLIKICGNCSYYEPNYGMHTVTGWTRDGKGGECCLEPKKNPTVAARIGCKYFIQK